MSFSDNPSDPWTSIFGDVSEGKSVIHSQVEPQSKCEEILEIKKTTTGGIETLGIWCPIHGFLKTGFVGP